MEKKNEKKMKIVHIVASFGKQSHGLGSIGMGLTKAQLGYDVQC